MNDFEDFIENCVEYRGVEVNKDGLKWNKIPIDEYIDGMNMEYLNEENKEIKE